MASRSRASRACASAALLSLCAAAQTCNHLVQPPAAGTIQEVPPESPMLVAPVHAVWDYPTISEAIEAWHTGSSLALEVPEGYKGRFNLTNAFYNKAGNEAFMEVYELQRIEFRLAPQSQNPVEAAFVHREVNGTSVGRWAIVVARLTPEAGSPDGDILEALFRGAELPGATGKREYLVRSSLRSFQLDLLWRNATFLHYWGPGGQLCNESVALARRLVRSEPLAVGPQSLASLTEALKEIKPMPMVPSTPHAFQVGACALNAACSELPQLPQNLSTLKEQEAAAMQILEAKRTALDQALVAVKSSVNSSDGSLKVAQGAEESLRVAVAYLAGVRSKLNRTEDDLAAAKGGWDALAPARKALPPPPPPTTTVTTTKALLLATVNDTVPVPEEPVVPSLPPPDANAEAASAAAEESPEFKRPVSLLQGSQPGAGHRSGLRRGALATAAASPTGAHARRGVALAAAVPGHLRAP